MAQRQRELAETDYRQGCDRAAAREQRWYGWMMDRHKQDARRYPWPDLRSDCSAGRECAWVTER